MPVYICEMIGDDTDGDGTPRKPFRTALRAMKSVNNDETVLERKILAKAFRPLHPGVLEQVRAQYEVWKREGK